MSHTRFKADAVTNRDITSYGNITGKYVFGNAAFMTGIDIASIPSVISADVRGNVIATGNVSATYFLGNGALLSGVSTSIPSVLYADVNGNIVSTGNITTYAGVSAGYYRGDGGGLFGIPQTGIQPGTFYRDISGNLIGNTVQAEYLFGNGYFLSGISSSIDTAGNLIVGGYIAASDIYANTITNSNNIRSNSLTILGNATAGGFIAAVDMYSNTSVISGSITANTINVVGNALVSGFLAATDVFSNNAIMTGNLSANGIVITGNSTIIGNSVVRGFIAATDVFSNNAVLTGNLSANGIVITGNSTIIGNSTVQGFMAAIDVFSNNAVMTGNVSANGIVIAGNASVSGFISTIDVYGINVIMTSNVSANNIALTGGASADVVFGRTDVIAGANLLATQVFANNITASTNLRANDLNISGNAVISGNIVAEGIFANTLTSYKDVVANNLYIDGNINTTGYISGGNIFGNSGYFKSELVANNLYIGGNIIGVGYLSIGNVYGNSAEFQNTIVFGNLSCANLSVTTVSAGNVTATRFIGNGALLTGILTSTTNEITADLFGNVTSSGTITTSGNFYAGSISGDGSNITNIALSSLQPGDIYRDIYGNITGTNTTMTGNVSCATVLASNIQAGNIQGIFNVAYSNLVTSPFNFQAQSGANLIIRSGTSTMALMRTDGIALTSNGPAYRFGTTDFDKGLLTNGSDNQYAANTSTGDMILHNTKAGLRTCIASSYGRPEFTLLSGNIGVNTTNPNVALDINGTANVGALIAANIQSGNVQGIFNVAYANLTTSPFNLSAQSGANLIIRSGTSTMIFLRTDGAAVVANGAAFRFGTSDFDKGVLTNGSDGQYGTGTLTGDLIVHNTKTNARTCLASSYNTPEITVFNGNTGIRTTSPTVALDVNGDGNIGNITSVRGNVGNIRLIGGNVAASGQINVTGNVVASFFLGNIIASEGNIGNVQMTGGNVAASGQINVIGNVVANSFIGPAFIVNGFGDILGNSLTVINVSATGNIITGGAMVGSYFSGNGAGLQNIPSSALSAGDLFKNISGDLTGNYCNVTIVNATTVTATNVNTGDIATGNILSASSTTSALIVNGNTLISGNINATNVNATDIDTANVVSAKSTTGSLTVNGDTGVTGNVNATNVNATDIATANVVSAKSTTSLLTVNGNTNVTGFVASTDLYSGSVYSSIYTGSSTNKYTASVDHEFYTSASVQVANITSSGNLIISGADAVKSSGSLWTNPSDRRLKDNIISANLDECFNTVRSLDLKSFSWKDNRQDGNVLGWIAQEVEEYLPKSITTREMFGLSDCKILNADQLYVNMYGALKKSIQMIETLKTEVEALKAKVTR